MDTLAHYYLHFIIPKRDAESEMRKPKEKQKKQKQKKKHLKIESEKLEQVLLLLGSTKATTMKWGHPVSNSSSRFTRYTNSCHRSLTMSTNFHILYCINVCIIKLIRLFIFAQIELAQIINWTHTHTRKVEKVNERTRSKP